MYHRYLQLPFQLAFKRYDNEIPTIQENHHVRIRLDHVDPHLIKWLEDLGVYVVFAEYFYTAPNKSLAPHCDTIGLSNVVKINWMYGGDDSLMDWYEMKPNRPLPQYQNIINAKFSIPDPNDVVRKQSFKIGKPSLVNVGQVHGVRNGKQARYVYSFVLGVIATQQQLQWDQANKVFAKYIK